MKKVTFFIIECPVFSALLVTQKKFFKSEKLNNERINDNI